MKSRIMATIAILLSMSLGWAASPPSGAHAASSSAHVSKAVTAQVTGKFTGTSGGLTGPGTFAGTIRVRHFVVANHKLVAQATIQGTLKDAHGKTKSVNQSVALPVQSFGSGTGTQFSSNVASASTAHQASCNILTLNLGAIHLNLLGLVVDLSPVNLTITGQTGPGNLLGNLLCGVAGLANGGLSGLVQTLLADIAMLLNQVLAL
jgi:hypothetical protein